MLLQKRVYEWSKALPMWQRDLLRRVAAGPLIQADRDEVTAILVGAKNAPKAVPLKLADLPADASEYGRVELRSIGGLRNVNCLAHGQLMFLEDGLNVVYGGNGTGKSGYGRLLRGVCRSAEREEVLPNVFEPKNASAPQTAEFVIAVDDVERTVSVDLAETPDRVLSAISAFDSSCARLYLTRPNVIEHVPRSLILLKALAEEQDRLVSALRETLYTKQSKLPVVVELDPQTRAGRAVGSLTAGSDIGAIEGLATLSDEEQIELERLEVAAASARADKSGELEAAARTRAASVQRGRDALTAATTSTDGSAVTAIKAVRGRLDAARTAESELADRAFKQHRFAGVGGDAWQEMWEATKRFVAAAGGVFPDDAADAACPLCQQELATDARARLVTFEEFVRSDLRDRVLALSRELDELLESLPDVDQLEGTVIASLAIAPEHVRIAGDSALGIVRAQVEYAKSVAQSAEVQLEFEGVADISALDAFMTDQLATAEALAKLRVSDQQERVLAGLVELRSRRALQAGLAVVKKRIKALGEIEALEAVIGQLGTQRISNQLRQLQEATVTERLRKSIREELEALNPTADQIKVLGQASKGETVIHLKMRDGCRAKVASVLSTGEQSAVATAFFLAELGVSENRSAIVLDDPASSYDHDHREYLARRLADEAKGRQVVIFTHDLTFLYFLQEAAEALGIELHGQTLERSIEGPGIVRHGLPTKVVSPSARRKELRRRLKFDLTPMHKGKKPEYELEADRWVADLRKGYDQLIEDYLLAGVVRRFHRNVRVRQLYKVKWSLELTERIDQAMAEASPKTHHEPLELYPRAHTPEELKAMLDEYDSICELTSPKDATRVADNLDGDLAEQAKSAGAARTS